MNTKKMAKRLKDSGVSPVIATILMVAITVVLAAVLYVMVSGFTHSPGTANSAGLTESSSSAGNYTATVSSASASNIPIGNLKIVISGASQAATGEVDGTYSLSGLTASSGVYTLTGTSDLSVTFTVIGGNSASYLNTGDYFSLSILHVGASSGNHLSGATVTLYDGNAVLGSVTL